MKSLEDFGNRHFSPKNCLFRTFLPVFNHDFSYNDFSEIWIVIKFVIIWTRPLIFMERENDFEIFTLIDLAREMTLLSSGVTSISPLWIWATFFLSRWHLILVLKEILQVLELLEILRVENEDETVKNEPVWSKMGFYGIKRY